MSQRNTPVTLQLREPEACTLMAEACTLSQVLDHVGGKWSVPIRSGPRGEHGSTGGYPPSVRIEDRHYATR
jgi:hypothetical protein